MKSLLLVYGTGSGCTKEIAERIGQNLTERGIKVEVFSAKEAPDPVEYKTVIVGSGSRAGQWHASVRKWVEAHACEMNNKPVAFFTVGLTAADPAKAEEMRVYTKSLIESTGIDPVALGLFAGCFQQKGFSFAERAILHLMKTPEGDFRDWNAIDAWSLEAAKTLGIFQ